MTITINTTGAERKRLVQTISHWLGVPAKYCGAPTFSYQVDCFTVDRSGNIHTADAADPDFIDGLVAHLTANGFSCESIQYDSPQQEPIADGDEPLEDCPPAYGTPTEEENSGICISMPRSLFTEANLENLKGIIAAKGNLIKKVLGVDDLPVEITDTKVSFPWFPGIPTPDEMKAYDTFICKLCEMARNQKRVVAKEKATDNDKYAFRCFLLRLGFIGAEYKSERNILLRNLSGSSAFKSGNPKVQEMVEQIEADADLCDEVMSLQNGGEQE